MFAATTVIAIGLALIQTWSVWAWIAATCLFVFWLGAGCIMLGELVGYRRGFLLALISEFSQALGTIAVAWSALIGIVAFVIALLNGFPPMPGAARR